LNEHLTDLRRELHRESTDQLQKQVLKGTRWLLVKHSADLDPKRDERQRLKEALPLNESLATAYYLKEDLAQVWMQENQTAARIVFDRQGTPVLAMNNTASTNRRLSFPDCSGSPT
jgi:hypothetical protein